MKRLVERILGRPDPPADDPRGRGSGPPVQPHLPPGRRLYCIGDIHGRLDLLQEVHARIVADAGHFGGSKAVVYLGDYIDRGAQSKQVLDLLCESPLPGFEGIHLLGNHERAMLDFLQHPEDALAWLVYGGRETLLSYGVDPRRLLDPVDPGGLRDALQARLPDRHRAFLASCRLMHAEGSYCFVHAGIRPGIPLDEQRADDLIWIREDFTHSGRDHGCIVVHGHSISDEVEIQPNRIGIDTGAFYSGVLSCLVLEGAEQRLLQSGRS